MFKKIILLIGCWMVVVDVYSAPGVKTLEGDTTLFGIVFPAGTEVTYHNGGDMGDYVKLAVSQKIRGVIWPAGTTLWFSEQGFLRKAFIVKDTDFGGITFAKGNVKFFDSGKVAQGNLAHDVEINGIKFTKHADYRGGRRAAYDISFFSSGKVSEGTFAENTEINGMVFKKKAIVYMGIGYNGADNYGTLFYENGGVAIGVLAHPQEINGIKFQDQIKFYENGRVEQGILAEQAIRINDVLLHGQITLYESGKVKDGLLVENTKVGDITLMANTSGHREDYRGSNDITEFYESGKIKSGILGEPVTISGEKVDAGWIAEFDENGNISKVTPFNPGVVY